MSALLISYDLNSPGQDYADLHEAIRSLGTSWWHFLDSTWIVSTTLTPSQAFAKLQSTADVNDSILIVDISNDTLAGWLPTEAWDWMNTHV